MPAATPLPLFIVRPLSGVYGWLSAVRNRWYDSRWIKSYRSTLPVISVGNLTAGGNSKTPLALYIVHTLKGLGYKAVLLSRGYGGSHPGPRQVSTSDEAALVGDEPLLMARIAGVPVVISRCRVRGAKFIERERLGDVIVLDDAFQHRRLARSLDVVAVNMSGPESVREFLEGKLLPLGLFREYRDAALGRAQALVFADRRVCDSFPALDVRVMSVVPKGLPVFRSCLLSRGVYSLETDQPLPPGEIVAFCGIARPEGFFESLEKEGFRIRASAVFPDHHLYSQRDLEKVRAPHPGLPLVCTEKDAVRISRRFPRAGLYQFRVALALDSAPLFQELLRTILIAPR